MSSVSVNTYSLVHTVTYVTSKMLLTVKEIIREIGLDPGKFSDNWQSIETAVSTWLRSEDLTRVTLEVYDPATNALVTRWDLDVVYGYSGDGSFWTDTQAIRYAILKAGKAPSKCSYGVLLHTKPGRPDVSGWGPCPLRSTEGFNRYGVGSTVGAVGIGSDAFYWRKS